MADVLQQRLFCGGAVKLTMHNCVHRQSDLIQELRHQEPPMPSDDDEAPSDLQDVDTSDSTLAESFGLSRGSQM